MEIDTIFRVAFICLFVMYLAARLIPSRNLPALKRSRKERIEALKQEGRYALPMFIIAIYGNLIAGILYLLNPSWISWSYLNLPYQLRILSIILGVTSTLFMYWVGQTLANYYSFTIETQEEHQLITTGPYRRIRHPLYAGTILFLISIVLVSDNLLILTILLLLLPGLYFRVTKEEQTMLEQFGDEYRTYMKQTGRLLPKLRLK